MKGLRKPQMVNDVLHQTTIDTSELKKVSVMRISYGEKASGIIYLEYEKLLVKVPYDTHAREDGLDAYITIDVGDEAEAKYYGRCVKIQLTEDMLFAARAAKTSVNVVQKHSDQSAYELIPLENIER